MSEARSFSERWAAVRGALEAADGALEPHLHAAEQARVLAARARALAAPPEAPTLDSISVLVVELAGERLAIETRYVFEIVGGAEVALLPGAEPPVLGISFRRGELLPVLDLARLLGLPSGGGATGELVVLGGAHPAFGVRVEGSLGLSELTEGELLPVRGVTAASRPHIRGTTTDAVLLLDAEGLIGTHS